MTSSQRIGQKRVRDEMPPMFMVQDKTPDRLRKWWTSFSAWERNQVHKHLKFLPDIMMIKPDKNVIRALVSFWDSTSNVFRFRDCEMTPTLEELGGLTGLGKDLHKMRPAAPRQMGVNNFLKKLCLRRVPLGCLENGWVPLDYLYNRFGDKKGFEKFSNAEFVNQLNYDAWGDLRIYAFMIAFLGTMVFPERGGRIRIRLAAVVSYLQSNEEHTVLPMILGDIFRALTRCQEGQDYFEGCNILLQMWFIEHLYHHPIVINFKADWLNYIRCHTNRAARCNLPEDLRTWQELLDCLRADQLTWNYYWFPSSKIMHMSTYRPFYILMGFRGFQPYAPLRVMRQLGREQKRAPIEDMRSFVWEFVTEETPRETYAQKVWFGSRLSDINEMVADRERGEVSLAYLEWFHNQPIPEQRSERSVKYAVDWEREIEARVREAEHETAQNFQSCINTLKEDKGILEAAMDIQQADFDRERAGWEKEREALQTQIREMQLAAERSRRSRSDQMLINDLERKAFEHQEDLEKAKAALVAVRTKWKRAAHQEALRLQQVEKDYDAIIVDLRKANATLRERTLRQVQDAKGDRDHCHNLMARMERQIDRLLDHISGNSQVLGAKNRHIGQLLREKDMIRTRINEIGHYITMRCLNCERVPRPALFSSIMECVHQVMAELGNIQKDLTPRTAARPNNAPRAQRFEALEHA